MSTQPDEKVPVVPASEAPKNYQSGVVGSVAVIAAWAWNQWQSAEVCRQELVNELLTEVCKIQKDMFYLEDYQFGIVVGIFMFLVGPLIRKYEKWGEMKQEQAEEFRAIAVELKKFNETRGVNQ